MTGPGRPPRGALVAEALEGLIGPETGVTSAVAGREPWAFLLMRGFAGPATDWRAVALADAPGGAGGVRAGESFEVGDAGAWRPRPHPGSSRAHSHALLVDGEGGPRVLVQSAGGATLGEVLDETAAQRARIDASYAVHLLAALAPTFVRPVAAGGGGAVSVDNVLLGFDGSVHARDDVPWWPRRRPARIGAGFLAPTDDAESVRLFGELAAELFASRRFHRETGLAFPGHEGVVRKEARSLVQWLLDVAVAPDVEDLWHEVDVPLLADVVARVDRLRRLVDPVTPLALATLVRHLFPERARREDALAEQVSALTRAAP